MNTFDIQFKLEARLEYKSYSFLFLLHLFLGFLDLPLQFQFQHALLEATVEHFYGDSLGSLLCLLFPHSSRLWFADGIACACVGNWSHLSSDIGC